MNSLDIAGIHSLCAGLDRAHWYDKGHTEKDTTAHPLLL